MIVIVAIYGLFVGSITYQKVTKITYKHTSGIFFITRNIYAICSGIQITYALPLIQICI